MILQIGIDLNIKDRNVQAIIDYDTGLIGFTEKSDNNIIEYSYSESPKEFKAAFFEKLDPLFADRCHTNFKISRKNRN